MPNSIRIILCFILFTLARAVDADTGLQLAGVFESQDEHDIAKQGFGYGASLKTVRVGSYSGAAISYYVMEHKEGDEKEKTTQTTLDVILLNSRPGKLDLYLQGGVGKFGGDRTGDFYHVGVGKFSRIAWELRFIKPKNKEEKNIYQVMIGVGF